MPTRTKPDSTEKTDLSEDLPARRRREALPQGNGLRATKARTKPNNARGASGAQDQHRSIAPSVNVLRPTPQKRADRSASSQGTEAPLEKGQRAATRSDEAASRDTGAERAARAQGQGVPEHVRRRFVQVGRKYYFRDGQRAFTDRGRRLTTPSENTEVIKSLVAIAQARGWNDITVTGSERFRREAWFAAKLSGLDVRGFRPTEFEQQRLARTAARSARESPAAPERGEPRPSRQRPKERDALLVGRLVDHGRASYKHNPQEPLSYFVQLETASGERTLWGVDLERALKESLTQPKIGDAVALRATRKDRVTVKHLKRNVDGKVVATKKLDTHRNRWMVEKREFFEARSAVAETVRNAAIGAREAVKEHPELAGTYFYLKGAEEIARRRIRDPEDRERFVNSVRVALADSVARGEPLPVMRLKERSLAKKHEETVLTR